MGVTGRHARRIQGATWWGLRLLACGFAVGGLAGTAFAGILGVLLETVPPNG